MTRAPASPVSTDVTMPGQQARRRPDAGRRYHRNGLGRVRVCRQQGVRTPPDRSRNSCRATKCRHRRGERGPAAAENERPCTQGARDCCTNTAYGFHAAHGLYPSYRFHLYPAGLDPTGHGLHRVHVPDPCEIDEMRRNFSFVIITSYIFTNTVPDENMYKRSCPVRTCNHCRTTIHRPRVSRRHHAAG